MKTFPKSGKKFKWRLNRDWFAIVLWSTMLLMLVDFASGDPVGYSSDYSIFQSRYEEGFEEPIKLPSREETAGRKFAYRSAGKLK